MENDLKLKKLIRFFLMGSMFFTFLSLLLFFLNDYNSNRVVNNSIRTMYNEGVFDDGVDKESWYVDATSKDLVTEWDRNNISNSFTVKADDFVQTLKAANVHAHYNVTKNEGNPDDLSVQATTFQDYVHIQIPSLIHTDTFEAYVKDLDLAIYEAQDKGKIILDFRDNIGGIKEAMILGVSSLLSDDTGLYTLVAANGTEETTNLKRTKQGDTYKVQLESPIRNANKDYLSFEKLHLVSDDTMIAILMNNKTASAAEFTIISLISSTNMASNIELKTFGQNTAGRTSANMVVKDIPNYDIVNIPYAWIKDSNGKVYHNDPIIPKVLTESDEDSLKLAQEWFREES